MGLSRAALAAMEPLLAGFPHAVAADFGDARRRWLAGDCPCCGMDAGWPDVDGTEPEPIAEGVLICGRCIRNGHPDPPVRALMLAALLP